MDPTELKQLKQDDITSLPVELQSLWHDHKGNWDRAHELVDGPPGEDAAWVHAYLHRKEGDIWNADYWYRRADRTRPDLTLDEEWDQLVQYFTK